MNFLDAYGISKLNQGKNKLNHSMRPATISKMKQ